MSDDVFVCAGKGAAEVMRRLRVDRDEARAELAALRADICEARAWAVAAMTRAGELAAVREALGCADGGDVLKAARVCATEAGLWRDIAKGYG